MSFLDFRACTVLAILAGFEWSVAVAGKRSGDEMDSLLSYSAESDAVCFLSKSWAVQRGKKSLEDVGKVSLQPRLQNWGMGVNNYQDADCPVTISIKGAEDMQDKRMGSFAKTEIAPSELHAQRPIYINNHNQYLYYWAELHAWRIGPDYTKEDAGLTSLSNHLAGCPTQARDWHAWDGRAWKRKHVKAVAALQAGPIKIQYGVFTSPKEKYAEQLKAVLNTWGRDVPAGRLTVVGVDGTNPNVSYKPAPNCADGHVDNAGISCKEATLLVEGHRSGADWMVVVGSDNYVIPRNFEEELSDRNPEVPVILAIWGCGAMLYCEDKEGGLCGGGGYAISRKALELMVGDSSESEHAFIKESKRTAQEVCGGWSDQVTSCIARRRGVRQVEMYGLQGWRLCEESDVRLLESETEAEVDCAFNRSVYRKVLEDTAIPPKTFHYILPEEMYELYEMQKEIEEQQAQSSLTQMGAHEGKGKPKEDKALTEAAASYERHRLAYVVEMDALMASGNLSRRAH